MHWKAVEEAGKSLKFFLQGRVTMNSKNEEQLVFLERERVVPIIERMKQNENVKKVATVQVQVNLKGFDARKDNKISKDMVLPYKVRRADKVIVIADEARAQTCREAGIPCASIEELCGDDKKPKRNSIFKENKYFILYPGYNKVYQLKNILRQGKTPYLVKSDDRIEDVYEVARRSYKLRIKDFAVTSFPVGHTGMESEEIYENIRTGVNLLISYLKKGLQNLKGVIVKTNQTKPIVLY